MTTTAPELVDETIAALWSIDPDTARWASENREALIGVAEVAILEVYGEVQPLQVAPVSIPAPAPAKRPRAVKPKKYTPAKQPIEPAKFLDSGGCGIYSISFESK